MTKECVEAYNAGVRAALNAARRAARALGADAAWLPTRVPFAIAALDEFALAGEALLISDRGTAHGLQPAATPRSPRPSDDALGYGGARSAGEDGNFGVSDAEIAAPSRHTLVDWLSGRTPMLASHWSRLAAAMLRADGERRSASDARVAAKVVG